MKAMMSKSLRELLQDPRTAKLIQAAILRPKYLRLEKIKNDTNDNNTPECIR